VCTIGFEFLLVTMSTKLGGGGGGYTKEEQRGDKQQQQQQHHTCVTGWHTNIECFVLGQGGVWKLPFGRFLTIARGYSMKESKVHQQQQQQHHQQHQQQQQQQQQQVFSCGRELNSFVGSWPSTHTPSWADEPSSWAQAPASAVRYPPVSCRREGEEKEKRRYLVIRDVTWRWRWWTAGGGTSGS